MTSRNKIIIKQKKSKEKRIVSWFEMKQINTACLFAIVMRSKKNFLNKNKTDDIHFFLRLLVKIVDMTL